MTPPRPRLVSFLVLLIFFTGCAHHPPVTRPPVAAPVPQPGPAPQPEPAPPAGPPPPAERQLPLPGTFAEEGVASWYGYPFQGRRTSNGEIYNMHEFTAAHRTLPFNAVVRVTNLRNGKHTEVRINDRGPFVANRVIDLSLSAAEALEMVGPGTAPVRLEIISGPNPAIGFFGVQVGAFLVQENAERLKAQLSARYSPVNIVTYDSPTGLFYRVRVGRVASEVAAGQLAERLRSDGQASTFVVRLDE